MVVMTSYYLKKYMNTLTKIVLTSIVVLSANSVAFAREGDTGGEAMRPRPPEDRMVPLPGDEQGNEAGSLRKWDLKAMKKRGEDATQEMRGAREMRKDDLPVSYTHLTLPTM
jgi:hypothetical protein